jgi:release factor glutamine methyltransferase
VKTDVVTPTVRAEVDRATRHLAAAGVASARGDAELLAAHVLGVNRSELALRPAMTRRQGDTLRELVRRRAERTPLQHLVGSVGFRLVELAVGPGVFVPRPETELVAGWAIDWLRRHPLDAPVVVDLCTGTGAIAVAVADEVPGAVVHAVELDPAAVDWARRNTAGTSVQLHRADAADALPELDGRVDLVVSNPPYVPDDERELVEPEVRDHDPAVALWAGGDGLDVLRIVVRRAAGLLRPGGALVVEHSDRQGESAPAVLHDAGGWADVQDHADLTGRPRYVTATRT